MLLLDLMVVDTLQVFASGIGFRATVVNAMDTSLERGSQTKKISRSAKQGAPVQKKVKHNDTRETVSSIQELDTDAERDARARTLTTLLAALNYNIANAKASAKAFSTVEPYPVILSNPLPNNEVPSSLIKTMKIWNLMAQLFVRSHEIVAILPKQGGSTSSFSMVVSTDSDSDEDDGGEVLATAKGIDTDSCPSGYFVARNPRPKSPIAGGPFATIDGVIIGTTSPQEIADLKSVLTKEDLAAYLHKFTRVSFTTHVASIELLLNRIVTVSHSGPEQCKASEVELLMRYITFRSAPKMQRRFQSVEFRNLQMAMRGLTQEKIRAVFPFPKARELSRAEALAFADVLDETVNREAYPNLLEQYNASDSGDGIFYSLDTVWEFHQLFLFVLAKAEESINNVQQHTKAHSQRTLQQLDEELQQAETWMGYLNLLIHCLPLVDKHIEALEPILKCWKPEDVPMPEAAEQTPTQDTNDLDSPRDMDEEDDDMKLEIKSAAQWNRAARECLWLSVSMQHAVHALTTESILPASAQPIRLTVLDSPGTSVGMHDWEGVLQCIYRTSAIGITGEEAVATLQEYGQMHKTKSTAILRSTSETSKPTFTFTGRWHAEAYLATLRYQSLFNPHRLVDTELEDLQYEISNSYAHIGVSKRCCPMCTKLISLLFPGNADGGTHSLVVLADHHNVYPTALPPFLPKHVARDFLQWLEELVRRAVDRLVLKRRRASAQSVKSAKSVDSKGQSPEGRSKEMSVLGQLMRIRLGASKTKGFGLRFGDEGEPLRNFSPL